MTPSPAHNVDRYVLLGAGGMLGRAWGNLLSEESCQVEAHDLPDFDLTSAQAVEALSLDDRTCVINCAAYTDVDGAESNREIAFSLNAQAPGRLAERCAEAGAGLLHYSTDYVFDGTATSPYTPDAEIHPLSVYGRSKADGEQHVRQSGARHLIIRTSWLYAPWGKNFVLTMMQLLRDRDALRVVNDQTGRPTSAQSLARGSLALWRAGERGTRHLCDGGTCTWYEFACAIAEQLGTQTVIEPCTTEDFPRPAPRPHHSVLDLSLSETVLGPRPHWKACLAEVVQAVATAKPSTAPN